MGYAQKIAFIDSEYILGNVPAYKAAQTQLDKISEGWQKEIEEKFKEIDNLYKSYQVDKVLLSEEMRRKKEDEIIQKEKAAKDLQKKYFGPEGELFKKRQELVKPIQDEIFKAVQDLATEAGYSGVFDTSEGTTIIYFNPKFDISDDVLKKMGYK
jgi:outer membrane protein